MIESSLVTFDVCEKLTPVYPLDEPTDEACGEAPVYIPYVQELK